MALISNIVQRKKDSHTPHTSCAMPRQTYPDRRLRYPTCFGDCKLCMHHSHHVACCVLPQMDALHESWEGDTLSDDLSWGAPPQLKAHAHADDEVDSALVRYHAAEGALQEAQQHGDEALAQQAQAALVHAQQDYDRAVALPGLSKGKLGYIELRPPTIRGSTAVSCLGTSLSPQRAPDH